MLHLISLSVCKSGSTLYLVCPEREVIVQSGQRERDGKVIAQPVGRGDFIGCAFSFLFIIHSERGV